jgi:CHASE3 domain sensor protein
MSHADRTACTSHCSRLWKSVSVSDDQATEVVEAFEEHLAVKIKEANARLEAQMKGLEAQQKAQTWLIGTLGSVIAIGVLLSALSPIITKMIR